MLLIVSLLTTGLMNALAAEKGIVVKDLCEKNDEKIDFEDFFNNAKITAYDTSGVTFQLKEEMTTLNIVKTVKVLPKNEEQAHEFIDEAKKEVNASATRSDVSIMFSGSNYRYKWDSTLIAKIYTTVYFTEQVINNHEYIKIDRVTGGIYSQTGSGSYVGSGTYITDNVLTIGQTGIATDGWLHEQNRTIDYSNSTRTFTAYPYSSWLPVANVSQSDVGCYYHVQLTHGGSTWSVDLSNNII